MQFNFLKIFPPEVKVTKQFNITIIVYVDTVVVRLKQK